MLFRNKIYLSLSETENCNSCQSFRILCFLSISSKLTEFLSSHDYWRRIFVRKKPLLTFSFGESSRRLTLCIRLIKLPAFLRIPRAGLLVITVPIKKRADTIHSRATLANRVYNRHHSERFSLKIRFFILYAPLTTLSGCSSRRISMTFFFLLRRVTSR